MVCTGRVRREAPGGHLSRYAPAHLLRFEPGDWPADDDQAALELWREARRRFAEIHGWPGGVVAMIQQHSRERVRLLGEPR